MSLLFETIRLVNGQPVNLSFHEARMNRSRQALLNANDAISLKAFLSVPAGSWEGIFKCRVEYGIAIETISIETYIPRKIKSLRLIEDNQIDYPHKYCNRDHLSELISQKGSCDEILIVKNGFITDTSFSNIIFLDGNRWVTPDSPLLPGTMRSSLLSRSIISEESIKVNDLLKFKKARLINAMLPFETAPDIEIGNIWY
jgi:4-amino-4-deoxychorismate lyase